METLTNKQATLMLKTSLDLNTAILAWVAMAVNEPGVYSPKKLSKELQKTFQEADKKIEVILES